MVSNAIKLFLNIAPTLKTLTEIALADRPTGRYIPAAHLRDGKNASVLNYASYLKKARN